MRDRDAEAAPVVIIRSSFVGDDPDRVRHLLDAENNERVVDRTDLDRDCPADLDRALQMFSALSASNVRARITVAHIKCSPFLALDEVGLLRMIEVVEREHGIPADQPRKVIVHKKGRRPSHVHLLYAAVNPATGRVLSSKLNYRADELAGRILELEFGEQIVPGPRIQKNAEALHARGEIAMAEVLAQYEPVRNRDRDTEADRQQGARTKMRPVEFRRLLAAALASSGPALPVPRALSRAGFAIALGDRQEVLMAVHMSSGAAYSLARSLKKIVPEPMVISDEDLGILRSQARPLAEVVRSGLVASHRRAEANVDREICRGLFEAAVDGDLDPFFAEQRRRRAKSPAGDEEMSQRARRAAIRAAEQTASVLHERRVNRALRAARILPTPARRQEATALAASGTLLAGPDFAMRMGGGVLLPAAIEASQRQSLTRTSLDSREQKHRTGQGAGRNFRSAVGQVMFDGDVASRMAGLPPPNRRHADRTTMRPAASQQLLASAMASMSSSLPLPRAFAEAGFEIALGDKPGILMAVHLATGMAHDLQSQLTPTAPGAMAITPDDLALLRAQARPLEDVIRDGLIAAHRRAEAQVDREVRCGLFEAAIDGEHDHVFSEVRRKRAQEPRRDGDMSREARRAAIRAAEQEAQRLLQRRIDRAFRAARILQTTALQKAAFALAISGGLLAGASLPIAIGAGFMVAAILKDQAKAQRADARALIDERKGKRERTRKARSARLSERSATFDFNSVPKESRVLAGIALRHMSQGWSTDLTAAVARALGPDIMDGLRTLHETGSEKQKAAVTGWASNTQRHIFAAAAALRRAGEPAAAASLERVGRRSNARAGDPGWDRTGG